MDIKGIAAHQWLVHLKKFLFFSFALIHYYPQYNIIYWLLNILIIIFLDFSI